MLLRLVVTCISSVHFCACFYTKELKQNPANVTFLQLLICHGDCSGCGERSKGPFIDDVTQERGRRYVFSDTLYEDVRKTPIS